MLLFRYNKLRSVAPRGSLPELISKAWSKNVRSYVNFSLSDLFGSDDYNANVNAATKEADLALPRVVRVRDRFVGPWDKESAKSLSSLLQWVLHDDKGTQELKLIFKEMGHANTLDLIKAHSRDTLDMDAVHDSTTNHVTWIGHATCAINIDGVRLLTDPMFSEYASIIQGIGSRRRVPAATTVQDLPQTDVVLLSHTHYDHLDENSAQAIGNRPLWVVPLGVGKKLASFGITNTVELDWWQECTMDIYRANGSGHTTLTVVLTPAKHWTARTPFDKNRELWGSFCVRSEDSDTRLFFGGDTAYCDVFSTIGERYGPFDMALLPIGAYKPRFFMKDVHCSPAEAVQIHMDLQAKQSLGVHWGTFSLANEDHIEPALELARARSRAGLSAQDFFTLAHGSTLRFGNNPATLDFASAHDALFQRYTVQVEAVETEEQ